ncbi:MAG: RNA polymerase sigma factor [Nitriliruptorales bacterium]
MNERDRRWLEMTDEELAAHCSDQLEGCLDELVRRYEDRIAACAHRMSLDRDTAEDAVQEILLRLIRSIPRFGGESAFSTWLYRLAHNTCVDTFRTQLRDRDRRTFITETPDGEHRFDRFPSHIGDPEADLDRLVQDCLLAQAIARLSDDYRQVLRLRVGEGWSNQRIADHLGTTVDAVKAKVRRARRQLRDELTTSRSCPGCAGLGAIAVDPAGHVVR